MNECVWQSICASSMPICEVSGGFLCPLGKRMGGGEEKVSRCHDDRAGLRRDETYHIFIFDALYKMM